MTDYPTHDENEGLKYQIQCIIKNEYDCLFMNETERLKRAERASEIIMKIIQGRLK